MLQDDEQLHACVVRTHRDKTRSSHRHHHRRHRRVYNGGRGKKIRANRILINGECTVSIQPLEGVIFTLRPARASGLPPRLRAVQIETSHNKDPSIVIQRALMLHCVFVCVCCLYLHATMNVTSITIHDAPSNVPDSTRDGLPLPPLASQQKNISDKRRGLNYFH